MYSFFKIIFDTIKGGRDLPWCNWTRHFETFLNIPILNPC